MPVSPFVAKLHAEARELSPFTVEDCPGRPSWVTVWQTGPVWSGHRDDLPNRYKFAKDPYGVLARADSSD